VFGGEQSGHMVYLGHSTTGDGMLAALKLLAVMRREKQTISSLRELLPLYPQSLVNVKVREKKPLADLPSVQKRIGEVEKRLGRDGRVVVRFSGTEAKARVLVEGPVAKDVAKWANEIANEIVSAIG
ncbi:MAG TPA: phosphoglucosamine mutase, partial [Myxococcota bacterium]|nr:phosphoglucosamine mutase [Myxococcota bacterium]